MGGPPLQRWGKRMVHRCVCPTAKAVCPTAKAMGHPTNARMWLKKLYPSFEVKRSTSRQAGEGFGC